MALYRLIKTAFARRHPPLAPVSQDIYPTRQDHLGRVLNVGGGSKQIAIPTHYTGWEHILLDIAPGPDADIVQDARNLNELPAAQFNAIYCSHNLEHYYRHDALRVLAGCLHVLQEDGFMEIRVPNVMTVMAHIISTGADIDDVLYESDAGPISAHDVFYGWGPEIERSGVDFYAHKQGFTPKSLIKVLSSVGFMQIYVMTPFDDFEIRVVAFKQEPTEAHRVMLNLEKL